MHVEKPVPAGKVGLSADRLDGALRLLTEAIEARFVPGLASAVYREGKLVRLVYGGARNPDDPAQPVERDTIFLIASLTKPIVCAGALLLLQEGKVALEQPVRLYVPEFSGGAKDEVRLLHLFTHTSGLCDQLPESPRLRRSQAPVSEFVKAVCRSELLFRPGTHVSYQSMGLLLLGEIIERVTGSRLRQYLHERLFAPLAMRDTVLGLPPTGMARVAWSLPAPFPKDANDVGDDWNTPYWRDFGAPWGGLHSTVEDLGAFLSHMLGKREGPLSPLTRLAMRTDQTALLPALSSEEKLANPWGLGWRVGRRDLGDLLSPEAFGHLGATGAAYWADPKTSLACVLLTNQPRLLRDAPEGFADLPVRFANAVAASVETE